MKHGHALRAVTAGPPLGSAAAGQQVGAGRAAGAMKRPLPPTIKMPGIQCSRGARAASMGGATILASLFRLDKGQSKPDDARMKIPTDAVATESSSLHPLSSCTLTPFPAYCAHAELQNIA